MHSRTHTCMVSRPSSRHATKLRRTSRSTSRQGHTTQPRAWNPEPQRLLLNPTTHKHMPIPTPVRPFACMHACVPACMRVCVRACMRACVFNVHLCIYVRTRTRACSCLRAYFIASMFVGMAPGLSDPSTVIDCRLSPEPADEMCGMDDDTEMQAVSAECISIFCADMPVQARPTGTD